MTKLIALIAVVGVVALWHSINMLVLTWVRIERYMCPADHKIVAYMMLISLLSAATLWWAFVELATLR